MPSLLTGAPPEFMIRQEKKKKTKIKFTSKRAQIIIILTSY